MRLPAPSPIPKWNVETNLRASQPVSAALRTAWHRVNLAWFRCFLLSTLDPTKVAPFIPPLPIRRAEKECIAFSPLRRCRKLLEYCHIKSPQVTLLATVASATHASRRDLKFINLSSHQKFAARVTTRATHNSARAATPGGCLAVAKTARKALIAVSTPGAKG